jgi:hypothetical protein
MVELSEEIGGVRAMTSGVDYFLSSFTKQPATFERHSAEPGIRKIFTNSVSMHDHSLCL